MDFLIGILLVIIILLLLFNFSSITISDTKYGSTCAYNNNKQINNVPKFVDSAQKRAINGKINIDDQTYDYRKYFFVK
jgi:anionic cell wall polymer biosynthesis LytR-Cps2A-Psr (LCP) family protein